MSDVVRSVTVKVRGDISNLERAYDRAGAKTDEFADKLDRAGENSKLVNDRQRELGTTLRSNNSALSTYNKHLDKMGSSSSSAQSKVQRLSGETATLDRRTTSLGSNMSRSGNQIDRYSGRLTLLLQAAVALGPGLIAGGTVPLAGLFAQAGATGVGLAVLVGSFQGVKDAVTAMNKAALEPSLANLQAEKEALDGLSPSAQMMAKAIATQAIPALKQLRDEGATTAFPGLLEGAKEASSRLPDVQALIHGVGDEISDLAVRGGKALASEDWDKAFNYGIAKTPGLLDDAATSVGNLTLAAANLWVAVDPLTQDFSGGLVDWTQKLADGSKNLGSNKDFQAFLAYAEKEGPLVAQTLGQVVSALVAVGEAGAPISGPLIKTLGLLANIVGNIAESDLGTPLVAGVLAMTAYGKATDLAARAQVKLNAASSGGKLGSSLKSLTADVRTANSLPQIRDRFGIPTAAEMDAQAMAAGRLRNSFGSLVKGGALIGAIGLASTGAADGLGLTNTATLALAGSLAGPLGAGAGLAVGALLDARAATKSVDDAIKDLNTTARGSDLGNMMQSQSQGAAAYAKAKKFNVGTALSIGFLQHPEDEQNALYAALQRNDAKTQQFVSTYRGLATLIGQPLPSNASPQQLLDFATKVQPGLDAAGTSIKNLVGGGYDALASAASGVQDYLTSTESVAGQTQRLEGVLTSTRLNADQLATSLNAVFSPKLNRSAANDAFIRSLDELRTKLKGVAGLTGNSAGALDNRDLVRGSVTALQAKIQAEADANASTEKMTRTLQRGRKAILDQGEAAGISRRQMRTYLDTLGLTPDLVRTLIELDGATEAQRAVRSVASKLAALNGTTAYVGIHITKTGADAAAIVGAAGARGMLIHPYAGGGMDVANRHLPEIARGQTPVRVWAEPETGGEAYIPLRNDARRPRAKEITALTANALGGTVLWNAVGSFSGTDYVGGIGSGTYDAAQDAQQIQSTKSQIDDLVRQLGRTGKKRLKGNARLDAERTLDSARADYEYLTHKAAYDKLAQDAQDDYDRNQAAADTLTQSRQSSYGSLTSTDLFARGASASSVTSSVDKLVRDIDNYTKVLASLKQSGASPALLKLVIGKAEQGDFTSAVRLGQSLLANPLTLGMLNNSLARLDTSATTAASLSNDPSFLSAGAYTGNYVAQTVQVTQSVQVDIGVDPTVGMRDLRNMVGDIVSTQLESLANRR